MKRWKSKKVEGNERMKYMKRCRKLKDKVNDEMKEIKKDKVNDKKKKSKRWMKY